MMDPSKKQSFEDRWKKAFDEASVPPPAQAWEGIEARLDLGASKPAFDDQWKQAFGQASVEPPAGTWKGIEERLEKDEKIRVLPLWWQSPRLWFAAASVAALLVAGGIWMNENQDHKPVKSGDIASVKVQKKPAPSVDKQPVGANTGALGQSGQERVAVREQGQTRPGKEGHGYAGSGTDAVLSVGEEKQAHDQPLVAHHRVSDKMPVQKVTIRTEQDVQKSLVALTGIASKTPLGNDGHSVKDGPALAASELARDRAVIHAELIPVSPYKNLDVFVQQRYVFYPQKQEPESPLAKKHQEYWAGIGVMPASFNPDVNVKTAPSTFQTQTYASQKSVTGKNEPGFSYALQTQGGVRISKHWSVETGVSFLQGNSQYEGGGYLLDASTNGFSNVLENALLDVSYANKGMSGVYPSGGSALANNSIYIDVSKQIRNDYRYVQLPVQAGFTLNPEGKLSYSVLGGMMANFFLSNELESANGNVIKTTASDEVYRSLNWAATTGLRFNYRISDRWKATLTGSYHQAVTSGFRSNQNLESRPYLYGVSWGMRYSF